jgi:AraC-like DNA-binding protein
MKRYILCYLVASGSGPENSCRPGPTSNTASLTPRCPGYSATLAGPPPDASRARAASAPTWPRSGPSGRRCSCCTPDAPVTSVGRAVGWPDQNYFARRFKAHYGLSAATYRKRFAAWAAAHQPGAL